MFQFVTLTWQGYVYLLETIATQDELLSSGLSSLTSTEESDVPS